MMRKIAKTDDSWASIVLRVWLAIVIFPHGAQKLFGWFGGYGFSGTMSFFTDTMGLAWIIGFGVIVLESVGSVVLLAGIAIRLWAVAYTTLALGIIFTSHIQHGFFMNWFGTQSGEGYEYFLLWIGMSSALVISGGGKFSLDAWLVKIGKESNTANQEITKRANKSRVEALSE